jgi:selenocysteine lyase/cysteine desulfurase
VLSIVDAIQSLGNQRIDVQAVEVDVLAAATYKWLLGIPGAAVLRVDDRVLDQLVPDRRGWLSVSTPAEAATDAELWPDARRFEVGTPSEAARRVLLPSVELLLEIGDAVVAAHALALTTQLIEVLDRHHLTVLTPRSDAARGAIVSFTTGAATKDAALARALLDRRVVVSRRGAGLRAAPHVTNTSDDIAQFSAVLSEISPLS